MIHLHTLMLGKQTQIVRSRHYQVSKSCRRCYVFCQCTSDLISRIWMLVTWYFSKLMDHVVYYLPLLYLRRNTLGIDQLLSPFISWKQEKSADGNWWHGWAKVTMPKMSSNSLQYLLLQEIVIEIKPERHDFMLMDLSAGTLFKDAMVDSIWQCLFRSGIVSTCWLASAQTISVTFYPATQYSSMDDFKSRNHSTWMLQWVVLNVNECLNCWF